MKTPVLDWWKDTGALSTVVHSKCPNYTFRLVTDDLAAVDVCFQLAVAELVLVAWPLEGVVPGRQLHPVAPHHVVVDHEAQGKQHIALKGCECAGHVEGVDVDALLQNACRNMEDASR